MSHSASYVSFVIVVSVISSFFVTRMGITPDLWVVSLLFMIVFALPAMVSLLRADYKQGTIMLLVLSAISLVIESFAIHTGFPYGAFYYEDVLGPKVLGLAPLAVPLGWIPLVISACAIVYKLRMKVPIVSAALLLVLIDLVMDPGAYALRIWIWKNPGNFYGVPFQNFLGWFFSGIIGAWAVKYFYGDRIAKANYTMILLSLIGILSYWSGIAFFERLWIPMLIGITLLGIFLYSLRAQNRQ